ncbi:MAG: S-layer homology domain-containing protein [Candidatus Gracilibacteria bacterium]
MINRLSFFKDTFKRHIFGFLLTLLVFSFFSIPAASAAGNLTSVFVLPYSSIPGDTNVTYPIQFNIETSLQTGDKLVIEFPVGFDISNLTTGDVSFYATGMTSAGPVSIDTVNRTATVEIGTVTGTITTMYATVYNITNAAAGFYELELKTTTSSDILKDSGLGNFVLAPVANYPSITTDSDMRGASTTYNFYYYGDIADTSNIRLQFPPEVDLSNVTAPDVTATLSTPAIVNNTSINTVDKYIDFSLDLSGIDHSGLAVFYIANIINPSIGGDFFGNFTVLDSSLNILSTGVDSFYISPPGNLYPTVEINTPLVGATATYTAKYTPQANIDNGWTIRATFPDGTDLSNVTSGDVSLTGATFNTPMVFIDNTNHYVEVTVDMPSGDSGGAELTLQIANVINTNTADIYELLIEDYNPSSLLIDSGHGDFQIVNSGNLITPISLALGDYKKNTETYYEISYTTPTSISDGWTLELQFDPLVDLSNIDPNDITVYGNNFEYVLPTVDNANHTITYVTDMQIGPSGLNTIQFYIPNIINPNTPGNYDVTITHKDSFGSLVDQGVALYPITSNLIVTPDNNQRLADTYYDIVYKPVANISDGYYVKVFFPAGVDLSNLSESDISNNGAYMSGSYSKTIDPIARTVEVHLQYSSGDSNGQDIYMNLYNVINPSTGGDLPVTMEIYNTSHTLVETLDGILSIAAQGTITPIVTLSDDNVSTQSTYTIDYTPSSALDNDWIINLDFPAGTDLSNVTNGDVSISGGPLSSPTVTVDAVNNKIQLITHISSNNSSNYAVQIVVNNVINTTPPGEKPLHVTELTDRGLVSDSGTGIFTLTGVDPSVGLINPVTIEPVNPLISQGSDYIITYTPPTNVDNNWKIRLTFPPEYNLTGLDIFLNGTNISGASNIVIDNTAKTITMDVQASDGDSNGDPIVISINGLQNPSTATSYLLMVEDLDPSSVLVDRGSGTFVLTAPLNSIPTSPTTLYSNTATNTAQTGRTDPLDLATNDVVFSALYNDPDGSDTATSYRLQVATDDAFSSIISDSGKQTLTTPIANGERSEDLIAGTTFSPGTTYYWRIKFWDDKEGQGAFTPSGASAAKFNIIDTVAPILSYYNPEDTYTNVDVNSTLSISFYDEDSDIDENSLDMTVSGINAVVDGVCQTGFSCSISPSGHYIDIYINKLPQLPSASTVPVTYSISDTAAAPNTLTGSYSFETQFAVGVIDPISISLGDSSAGSTDNGYYIDYTPPTNIDDHWKVLLTFPPEIDLSALSAGDIDIQGTNITMPHNVVIDDGTKTILIEIQTSGGDTNGDEINIFVGGLTNPNPGSYTIGVDHLDVADTLIDQGSGNFRISGIIDPINVTLTDYHVGAPATQSITYTPPTNINDHWSVVLSYPDVFDLTGLTSGDVNISGTNITGTYNILIDADQNIIEIEVQTTGDSNGDPITVTVDNIENPCAAVLNASLLAFVPGPNCSTSTFYINVLDYDENDLLIDQGDGTYTTIAPLNNYPGSPDDLYSNTTVNTAQSGEDDPYLDSTDVVFSAIYKDVNPGDVASKYQLQIATDDEFTDIIYDSGSAGTALNNAVVVDGRSEDITIPGGTIDADITYYWRIKFWDNNGAEGAFSADGSSAAEFTVLSDQVAPLATSIPAMSATNVSPNTNIQFDFTDPGTGINLNNLFIDIDAIAAVSGGVCETGYVCTFTNITDGIRVIINPDVNLPVSQAVNVNYYVEDNAFLPNYLQDTLTFTTGTGSGNNTPTAPTNLFSNTAANTAQSGSTDPANLNSTSVVFSGIYNDVDTSDTATQYILDIATDAAFTDIIYASGATTLTNAVSVGNRSEDIVIPNGTINVEVPYYWRLAFVDNNNGTGAFSSTAQFMVADSTAPTLTSSTPTDSATGVSVGTNIVLNFSDTETPIDVSSINITIGGINAITGGVCQTGYTCNTTTPTANTAQVTITPAAAFSNAANITIGYSVDDSAAVPNALSSSLSFTTEAVSNSAPSAPTAIFANTAVNTAQSGSTNPTNLDSTSVVVSGLFQDTDTSDTAVKYQVQVATDSAFTSVVYDSGSTGTNLTTPVAVGDRSEDLAIPGGSLAIETPYYYRIKFWDDSDTAGAFSSTAQFMVADLVAPILSSSTPINGATGVATTAGVELNFTDADTSVSPTSINVAFNGSQAITNGVCQSGYSCTITAISGGQKAVITHTTPFPAGTSIAVNYMISDTALVPNTYSNAFSFTTQAATPPVSNGGGGGGSGGGYVTPIPAPTNFNQNLRESAENMNSNAVTNINQNTIQNQNQNTIQNQNTNTPQQNLNQNTVLTQPDLAKRPNSVSPSTSGVPYIESVCPALQNLPVPNYSDITDAELQNYINQLNRYGIHIDSTDNRFLADAPVTRSEILKYLIQGSCEMYRNKSVSTAPFPDVSLTHKDVYYVTVGKDNGVVTGYLNDGTYKPDRPISRAEALKVMIQVFTSYQNIIVDGQSEPFSDVNGSEWYAPYIRFAYEQHIISDTPDHKFNPNSPATREEIAEFLAKALILKSGILRSPEDLKPVANVNQNTAPVVNKNTNSLTPPEEPKTPANSNTNEGTIPERTILKEGKVPYAESVCPSIEAKTKTTYGDLTNKDLAKFVDLLIKSGVAFVPEDGKFNENAMVARSELLRFVIEGNCEDFKLENIKKAPFPDVPVTHKDVFFIYAAKLRNIISGYLTDGTYKPDNDVSRAEALKIILEVTLGDGKRTFTGNAQDFADISWNDPLAWYRGYVSYAIEKGIISIEKDKKFRPNDKATRKEIIYFLSQALNIKNR